MSDDPTGTAGLHEQVRAARLRLADCAADLGTLLRLLGEHAEAERLLRRAVEIYEADRRTHPATTSRGTPVTSEELSCIPSASKPSSSAEARQVSPPDTTSPVPAVPS
ncbi:MULTISPECIES: tetratricopeptide repeat protein [unclassified Streptomyces]|uniref:tetratricopeptide repeat protein n=1 Tax=unclassified Streptomyces TaxID=2593676 RepID=UPI00224D6FCF|nr:MULTISPECIES: tetratricopeptide repeat protein [unclassified Streptomyces]MCX5047838.1 tetratricopeptide repeat protein [Streptomyces sp. NBC_00474]MCX5057459.1 tetratricopeptide repeat protein [Streptomyces sp. NBC_00452]